VEPHARADSSEGVVEAGGPAARGAWAPVPSSFAGAPLFPHLSLNQWSNLLGPVSILGTENLTEKSSNAGGDPERPTAHVQDHHLRDYLLDSVHHNNFQIFIDPGLVILLYSLPNDPHKVFDVSIVVRNLYSS